MERADCVEKCPFIAYCDRNAERLLGQVTTIQEIAGKSMATDASGLLPPNPDSLKAQAKALNTFEASSENLRAVRLAALEACTDGPRTVKRGKTFRKTKRTVCTSADKTYLIPGLSQ